MTMVEWREQRDRAVAAHAAALAKRQAAESEQARKLVAGFVRQARERGLPTTLLNRRAGIRGWYLNRARTLAVDVDGNYYAFGGPPGIFALHLGAAPRPQDPRLIVGEGARDGESLPLRELLHKRLS